MRTIADTTRTSAQKRAQGPYRVEVLRQGLPASMLAAQEAIEQGRMAEAGDLLDAQAEKQLEALLDSDPVRLDAMLMMGLMLSRLCEYERAANWFKRVLAHAAHVVAHQQLACIYEKKGDYAEATNHRLQALSLDPENPSLWSDLGIDLIHEGRLGLGLDWLYRTVECDPTDRDTYAKLLFYLHYLPNLNQRKRQTLFSHCRRLFPSVNRAKPRHVRNPAPNRRLRIGYISADFRRHSVAYTFEAIMTHHNPQIVEVFAYHTAAQGDVVTERIAQAVTCFRDVSSCDTPQLAELIDEDRVDILVFLGGFTDGHRMDLCTYRPAPIQVDWGSIHSTGLDQIDYRLADPMLDEQEDQVSHLAKLIHLPHGSFCYRPPDFAPPVSPLPVQQTGVLTFGSCNSSVKINPEVIELWAQVLKATPNSRLLLKFAGGHSPRMRQFYLSQFAQHGVPPARVQLYGWTSAKGHLDTYHRIDIALDPFPFNGCVTTLEALWMGVPVVTLAGQGPVGAVGKAILSRAGLDGLVASTLAEYVVRAVTLARNIPVLARMRAGLRECLAASCLCDTQMRTRDFEQAYREIWHRWCAQQQNQAPDVSDDVQDEDILEFFISERSPLRYVVNKRGLPPALLQTARIIQAGDVAQGKALLDATVLTTVLEFIALHPQRTDALFMVAVLLKRIEEFDRAHQWFALLLQRQAHVLVYFEMAGLCRDRGQLSAAIDHMKQALALAPDSPELKATLADYLIKAGQQQQGVDLLRQVVKTSGDIVSHSKCLWHQHQLAQLDRPALYQAHRQWSQLYAPLSLAQTEHVRDRNPNRPLRIGYLSGDFCSHSVAYFFEPLLEAHTRAQVEVWGYANCPHQDSVTERLRQRFDHYRNVCGVSDEQVVTWIEQDRIDILVDLSGHTGENRLGVLAYKPAPIQVSFLGYPDTTGMSQIDYRFTDQWADAPDAQQYYTEKLVQLDSGFICYRPPEFAPPVRALPAASQGHVTFGSFNNSCKINARVIDLWARILQALPSAQLLLKFGGGDDERVRAVYLDQFRALGVAVDRICIKGRLPVLEHLELYSQVDIALDSFPYHGTTTTCEALWMGVPTVSLIGQHHVSRVGLSLLSRAGLEVFTANTEQEYVARAVSFARQTDHLQTLRKGLRTHVWRSPLCDKQAYTRCVETAYRRMWQHWCHTSRIQTTG